MSPKKGRKQRPDRTRGATPVADGGARQADVAARQAGAEPAATTARPSASRMRAPLPSRNARMTGFLVALVTAFLAIALIRDAATNAAGAEAIVRVAAGAGLVALAIIVAPLVLFPEQLQAYFARRRGE